MKNELTERIQLVCRENDLSVAELAKQIGVAQRTANSYINEGRTPNMDFISRLTSTFKLDANWLLTGKGHMFAGLEDSTKKISHSGISENLLLSKHNDKAIPYYADLPVSAGEKGLSDTSKPELPAGFMSIPGIVAKYLFPVIGYSMQPIIKPGDIIGVNPVDKWDRVEPDKIYMIVTTDERMIKRLRIDNDNEDLLWCISENYKEFKIYKSEIKSIFHVVWHGGML